ncbi:LptF/LptG family permease [Rubritalea marina]|uniref:LptF/LptG family permease n=1 Tax=Rubritalea marina TaxID=361055 RepID=UPI000372BA33|nr:LptF/LptG family permease [Rubritalea marina]
MLTFDRYIGKQILSTTLSSVMILSGVFLLGNIFKEARPLFVGQQPSAQFVLEFIFSIFPFSLIFTVPFSFLAAIMIVFGRLSTDNEILSMRMAGQSLPRIAIPVFLSAAVLSAFCYWLNIEIAPKAKEKVQSLLVAAVKENPNKFLDPGVVQTQLADKRIYVQRREGDILYGVHIHEIGDPSTEYAEKQYTFAQRAELAVDIELGQLQLKLQEATLESINDNGLHTPIKVEAINPVIFDFNIDEERTLKPTAMSNEEIHAFLAKNQQLSPEIRYDFEREIIHRRSYSLACLAFAVIGIPLGMTSKRRESSSGFILALAVGLGYFLFHIFANQTKVDSRDIATLLYWAPNLLALLIGCFLFYRKR